MKEIPNRTFTLEIKPGEPATTAKLLELTLQQPPPEGFTFAVMRARNRVADAISKVAEGDVIKLEDADYETAKRAVEAFKWAQAHRDLLTFAEQFGL